MRLSKEDLFSDSELPFTVLRRDPQVPYPLHGHEFTELVLVYAGNGEHYTEDNCYEVGGGDVFIVTPGHIHGYRKINNLCLVNLMYDRMRLNFTDGNLRSVAGYHALLKLEPLYRVQHNFSSRLRLTEEQMQQALSLVGRIEDEAQKKEPGYVFMATAYFMQLLGFVSRCYGNYSDRRARPILQMAEAISHLEQHFTEKISLSGLAKLAHMSQNSFLRAFSKVHGISPIAYQINLRMNLARDLLLTTDLGVSQVAARCGYDDSNYFTRQFKKLFAVSPKEFRKISAEKPS